MHYAERSDLNVSALTCEHPMPEQPAWIRYCQEDLPCQFSPEQAGENAAYLTDVLGSEFIAESARPPVEVKNPLLQRWVTQGAAAFLELNALAKDLRVVDGVPGVETVLNDLRNARLCPPALHVIHSAALLGRSPEARVERFFPQTEERFPDFLVRIEGAVLAVEAKLLTKSEKEQAFTAYASHLAEQVMEELLKPVTGQLHVLVVIKDVETLPPAPEVIDALRAGTRVFAGDALHHRGESFNFFIEAPLGQGLGLPDARGCYILCPKSANEDLRVLGRSKIASKQLFAPVAAQYPGIFCLGVNRLQDPVFIAQLLRRRFTAGQYSGISGVLLLAAGVQLGPPQRAYLDRVASVRNSRARLPMPNIPLCPVGVLGGLLPDGPQSAAVPAYRYAVYRGTATVGDQSSSLLLPDLLNLTPELLAGAVNSPPDVLQ